MRNGSINFGISVLFFLGSCNQRPAKIAEENPSVQDEPQLNVSTVVNSRLDEVKTALAKGGTPGDVIESTYGLTRMHVAAREGDVSALRFLIEHGGDVNIRNTGGNGTGGETPLHWASSGEVVDLLLSRGGDLNLLGAAGQTALASASMRNRPSAVARLIELGADVNAKAAFYDTPVIVWACIGLVADYQDSGLNRFEDRMAIITQLVSHGADINGHDKNGQTALHVAAKYNARFVALLLRLGADPLLPDHDGKLPIDWARECKRPEATRLLEIAASRPASPN